MSEGANFKIMENFLGMVDDAIPHLHENNQNQLVDRLSQLPFWRHAATTQPPVHPIFSQMPNANNLQPEETQPSASAGGIPEKRNSSPEIQHLTEGQGMHGSTSVYAPPESPPEMTEEPFGGPKIERSGHDRVSVCSIGVGSEKLFEDNAEAMPVMNLETGEVSAPMSARTNQAFPTCGPAHSSYVKVLDTPVALVEDRDEQNRRQLESIVVRLETALASLSRIRPNDIPVELSSAAQLAAHALIQESNSNSNIQHDGSDRTILPEGSDDTVLPDEMKENVHVGGSAPSGGPRSPVATGICPSDSLSPPSLVTPNQNFANIPFGGESPIRNHRTDIEQRVLDRLTKMEERIGGVAQSLERIHVQCVDLENHPESANLTPGKEKQRRSFKGIKPLKLDMDSDEENDMFGAPITRGRVGTGKISRRGVLAPKAAEKARRFREGSNPKPASHPGEKSSGYGRRKEPSKQQVQHRMERINEAMLMTEQLLKLQAAGPQTYHPSDDPNFENEKNLGELDYYPMPAPKPLERKEVSKGKGKGVSHKVPGHVVRPKSKPRRTTLNI